MQIEQAVFTSDPTGRGEGYHLVAWSPGLTPPETQELSAWGPSHDSLLPAAADSVNFHGLSSGRWVLSRSSSAGHEPSGRRGPRIHTQFLVFDGGLLDRFGGNPFAVLRAALAQGALETASPATSRLETLRLPGRAAAYDAEAVIRAAQRFGAGPLASLFESVRQSPAVLLVVPEAERRTWIDALFHCLPAACRRELSFCTGLRPSARRPFRLSCATGSALELARLARAQNAALFDPTAERSEAQQPLRGWAQTLCRGLSAKRVPALVRALEATPVSGWNDLASREEALRIAYEQAAADTPAGDVKVSEQRAWDETLGRLRHAPHDEELWGRISGWHEAALAETDGEAAGQCLARVCSALGPDAARLPRVLDRVLELLARQWARDPEWAAQSLRRLSDLDESQGRNLWVRVGQRFTAANPPPAASRRPRLAPLGGLGPENRGDAPHAQPRSVSFGIACPQDLPALARPRLGGNCLSPEILEALDALDELVFAAIGGRPEAFSDLKARWKQVAARVPAELREESKLHYVRRAMDAWKQVVDGREIRDPAAAMQAMDVICLLLGL